MAFGSMSFLFGFLPLTLLCYFLMPRRWRSGRNLVLLLFSLLLLRFLSEEIECYANPDENYEDDEHDYHRCTHEKTLLYTIFRLIRI